MMMLNPHPPGPSLIKEQSTNIAERIKSSSHSKDKKVESRNPIMYSQADTKSKSKLNSML